MSSNTPIDADFNTVPHAGAEPAARVVLLGAGALARDVVEVVGVQAFCGVYVDPGYASDGLCGLPLWRDWASVRQHASHYSLGLLDPGARQALQAAALANGLLPAPPLVSHRATVSPLATLAAGVMVGHNAQVGPMAKLQRDVLVMHCAVIGHDSEVGEGTVVLPGAWVGGYARIGAGCFIGANAVVSPQLEVGAGCKLAPGAACLRSLPADSLLIGNPGRASRLGTA